MPVPADQLGAHLRHRVIVLDDQDLCLRLHNWNRQLVTVLFDNLDRARISSGNRISEKSH
jgi:hypothetical protein